MLVREEMSEQERGYTDKDRFVFRMKHQQGSSRQRCVSKDSDPIGPVLCDHRDLQIFDEEL
jgi:hypothetical protein